MTERVHPHITKVAGRWWAWNGRIGVTPLVGPCDSHAEVIEQLDAMRPTLEPCS